MGLFFSRFRKRPTTLEQLKKIEDGLRKIEDYKRSTERTQKKLIANIIIYSAALYIISCIIVFVWYLPESWVIRLALLIPLVLVPVIVFWLKRLISKYFNSKMVKANEEYADLQRKKKDIIDNVMETETFNKAREILAKYAPEKLEKKPTETTKLAPNENVKAKTDLRQRNVSHSAVPTTALKPFVQSTQSYSTSVMKSKSLSQSGDLKMVTQKSGLGPRAPMPQPMFPTERSITDKLVEYIIGDGPSYRYALICKNCKGHNGMALKEEFPYMAFNCCYCFHFNPARSQRPLAPKLLEPEIPLALPSSDNELSHASSMTFIAAGANDKLLKDISSRGSSETKIEELRNPEDIKETDEKNNEERNEITEETEDKSDDDFQSIGFSKSDFDELKKEEEKVENNQEPQDLA